MDEVMKAILVLQEQYATPLEAETAIQRKIDSNVDLTEAERIYTLWMNGLPLVDVHKHRCPRCMAIWEHDGAKLQGTSEQNYQRAHLCPRGCGVDIREKYFPIEVEVRQ